MPDMPVFLEMAMELRHDRLPLDVAEALEVLIQTTEPYIKDSEYRREQQREALPSRSHPWHRPSWPGAGARGRVSRKQMARPMPVPIAAQNLYLVDTL